VKITGRKNRLDTAKILNPIRLLEATNPASKV